MMKPTSNLLIVLFLQSFCGGVFAQQPATPLPEGGVLIIQTDQYPKPEDAVVQVETATRARFEHGKVVSLIQAKLRVSRGKPERISIPFTGTGRIVSVAGGGVTGWAERRSADGSLVLEVLFEKNQATPVAEHSIEIRGEHGVEKIPSQLELLMPTSREDLLVSGTVKLEEGDISWVVGETRGLLATSEEQSFALMGAASLKAEIMPRGGTPRLVEWAEGRLTGGVNEMSRKASFVFEGRLIAREAGHRIPFLRGTVAVTSGAVGDGWRLVRGEQAYEMEVLRSGEFFVRVEYVAEVQERQGWKRLDCVLIGAGSVPVTLRLYEEGEEREIEFLRGAGLTPAPADREGGLVKTWLPANGLLDLGWRTPPRAGEGSLFVNSMGRTDLEVSTGQVRGRAMLDFAILQGKLEEVAFALEGEGEVMEVTGTNVSGWRVEEPEGGASGERLLVVSLSRPAERSAQFQVRFQSAVATLPAPVSPLRIIPRVEQVRHAGLLRVRTEGAVRFDATRLEGLMQLAPEQWDKEGTRVGGSNAASKAARTENEAKAEADEVGRQVQVYRFPIDQFELDLNVRQVFPEVAVNQITLYELTETDRVIRGRIELDVREAPLREWTVQIPAGYAVSSVSGREVADYSIVGEESGSEERRTVRVHFGQRVKGRALVEMRLEKSAAAAAGEWALDPLIFPDARAVRGFVGVVTAPGYRVVPLRVGGLSETPLNFFPQQERGLQQAFRLREADWSGVMQIEALGQSIVADLFHLYTLKEGVVYGSVVLNFFVVGAPVNEWRLEVPKEAGNLVVDGQDVQSWRQEGDQVVIGLNRPSSGAVTLLATFEHPMSQDGGTIQLGEVRPLGVAAERGYIQVVSPLQVRFTPRLSENLLRLESNELPRELRLLTNAPSLLVTQYINRPFELAVDVEWYERSESVPMVVEFAKLDSRVATDGQVATNGLFFVKARGTQSLELQLPKQAELWETKVNGEAVNARREGDGIAIPLTGAIDPSEVTQVVVRFGRKGGFGWRVTLEAPRLGAPVLATQWTATSESGRVLVPASSPSIAAGRVLPETGLVWMQEEGKWISFLILAGAIFLSLVAGRFGGAEGSLLARVASVLLFFLAVGGSAIGLVLANELRHVTSGTLSLSGAVAGPEQAIAVPVWNLPQLIALISPVGLLIGGLGVVGFLSGLLRRGGLFWKALPVWWGFVALGLLMQHGGAVLFYGFVGVSLLVGLGPFLLWSKWPRWKGRKGDIPASAALLIAALWLGCGEDAQARERLQPGARAGQALGSLMQEIRLTEGGVVEATARLEVEARVGEVFELLSGEAVLVGFEGEGLQLSRIELAEGGGASVRFVLRAERAGRLSGRLRYRMALGRDTTRLTLPTGAAAAQVVEVRRDEPGWRFASESAVGEPEPLQGLAESESGSRLLLGVNGRAVIEILPQERDPSTEKLSFFVEGESLYIPGPGLVDGLHRLRVRVARGEMRETKIKVPEGFVVESVAGDLLAGTAGNWQFDPATRLLSVTLPGAQRTSFDLLIAMQKPLQGFPTNVVLSPLRVEGAVEDTGRLALGFGTEAQSGELKEIGLLRINLEDFDLTWLKGLQREEPGSVQRVFRYGQKMAELGLTVQAVEPELRVQTMQVFSVGEERTLQKVDLEVDIRRAGVFRLQFGCDAAFEVETMSGEALSHWSESVEGARREVTLHLKEQTIGRKSFAIVLTGPPVVEEGRWSVPRLHVLNAARMEGRLVVVPEQGRKVRSLDRVNVSQIDAREAGDLQPGSIAFRLLQTEWELTLGIEILEPWVTAQTFHRATVREGQVRHEIAARFRVENAAVKTLRLRIPGLSAESANSVRAEGEGISNIQQKEDGSDEWEIRFRRGMMGDIPVTIHFLERLEGNGISFALRPVSPVGARQVTPFAAVEPGGRLELAIGEMPVGWQKVDFMSVPLALRQQAGLPTTTFRIGEEGSLQITGRRQELAEALKLRVEEGELVTVFSARGDQATLATLKVRVNEKSRFELRLPAEAELFHVAVNGEEMTVVREANDHLFHVVPGADLGEPATVEFGYGMRGGRHGKGQVNLSAPGFNVPLQNLTWRVRLPEGWDFTGHKGPVTLRGVMVEGRKERVDYLSGLSLIRSEKMEKTKQLMSAASDWLRAGDQDRAREALNRAAKTRGIDEATSEDARVQLRNLFNEQAVVGLNTRRQALILDNSGMDASVVNEQVAQAARANPLLQGRDDFAPGQMEEILQGNTFEEVTALTRVAERIVSQQIAADAPPQSIALAVPQQGKEVIFGRSVQVEGGQPLRVEVGIRRAGEGRPVVGLLFLIATGVLAYGAQRLVLRQ